MKNQFKGGKGKGIKMCMSGYSSLTITVTMAMVPMPLTCLQMTNDTIPPTYNKTLQKLLHEDNIEHIMTKFISIFVS